jgi:diguanylate cyclase (GGDEF)-like protein
MGAKNKASDEGKVGRSGVTLEAERARRYEANLSVLLVNVDGLKLMNQNLGKPGADEVLSELASLIRANIRKIDVFGRWDAEDFVILTVDRNSFGSIALAEKLRRSIADHTFDVGGKTIRSTVSIGVARGLPGDEREIDGLIQAARLAVLRAKTKGRNRVEYADTPDHGAEIVMAAPEKPHG